MTLTKEERETTLNYCEAEGIWYIDTSVQTHIRTNVPIFNIIQTVALCPNSIKYLSLQLVLENLKKLNVL